MKNILILITVFSILLVELNAKGVEWQNPNTTTNTTNQAQLTQGGIDKTKDQESIQQALLKAKYLNMISSINYKIGRTYRIPLRVLIKSFFIFENDKIAFFDVGDKASFLVNSLKERKYDFSNILEVTPELIGVDSNLFVIGESGNIYNFYIYSTDHKSDTIAKSVVYISEEKKKIDKIEVINLEKQKFDKEVQDQEQSQEQEIKKEDQYITIGEGKNILKINKAEIIRDFKQKGEKEDLKADEIFRDKKFVYFKFDKDNALRKFPTVYRVIDGFDNPANTRVVGDYIIAETVSNKFTLRYGNSEHICVRRIEEKKDEKQNN